MRLSRRASLMLSLSAFGLHAAPKKVKIAEFDDAGHAQGIVEVEKVTKSDKEWRAQLSADEFRVTREQGTEQAFTGKLNKTYSEGVYRCICCGTALFDSSTKFDSGTGWPSFWAPIAKQNVKNLSDVAYGMVRVENQCARCDAHLGHVFEDGPRPTGLRYCMNSVSLRFVPRAKA